MKYLYYALGLSFLFLLFQPNWIHQKNQVKQDSNPIITTSPKVQLPHIVGEYQSSQYYLKLDSGQVYTFLYQNQKTGEQIKGNWELSIKDAASYIVLQIPTTNKQKYAELKFKVLATGLEDIQTQLIYQKLVSTEENKLLVIRD